MKVYFFLLASVLALVGLAANSLLYSSLAVGLFSIVVYVALGLCFDLAKLGMLPLSSALFRAGRYVSGAFAGVFFAVLTAISLLAVFGFQMVNQSTLENINRADSDRYKAASANLEAASAKVQSLGAYADSSKALEVESELVQLRAQESAILSAAAGVMQADCTPKTDRRGQPFTTRAGEFCTQIQPIRAEISRRESFLDKHRAFAGAKALEASRAQELVAVPSAGAEFSHPLFRGISEMTGISTEKALVAVLAVTGCTAEGLASFLLFVVFGPLGGFGRRRYTLDEVQAVLDYVEREPLLAGGAPLIPAGLLSHQRHAVNFQ